MKKCSKCGVEQPLESFYKASGTRDGLRGDCKGCFQARAKARYPKVREQAIERARAWRFNNPERERATKEAYVKAGRKRAVDRRYQLKRKYGITPEQYDELLAQQGGVCAICGRQPTPGISLHVDHDHDTGCIRGLLCFRCNNALGDFDDSINLLEAAMEYVLNHHLQRRLDELLGRSA